jgi:formiminotetrahydrofolate cyclodeaminase
MDTRLTELSVAELVARLATDDPVPGGGSASALAGAMGAALVQMVVELTSGRSASADDDDALTEIRGAAASLQSELLRLAEADSAAYASVVAARRMPRGTDLETESRRVQLDAAIREATRAPMYTAGRAGDVLVLAERLAPIGSRHAISDVGVAGHLAAAAIRGAALNVEINLPYVVKDEELAAEARQTVDELLRDLERRERALTSAVNERIG